VRACVCVLVCALWHPLSHRLQCFVFILEFNARLHDLSENVEVVTYALHDIKRCSKLSQVFEILLAMGNYLNGTGPRGGAYGEFV
jgi:hypothetical protein